MFLYDYFIKVVQIWLIVTTQNIITYNKIYRGYIKIVITKHIILSQYYSKHTNCTTPSMSGFMKLTDLLEAYWVAAFALSLKENSGFHSL